MAFDNVRDRNRAIAIAAGVAVGGALCYYGYSQAQQRLPPWRKQQALLREYADAMLPSTEKMQALQDDILKQMRDSLAKKHAASILMLPTYVLRLPDGTERGATFAIDIGGTNFRCYYCELGEKKGVVVKEDMEQVSIPRDVLTGNARQLFDFLAINLAAFIRKHSDKIPPGTRPVVGFGFSFAMDQQALNSGVLMKWTKGFDVSGVVNKDVVPLLSEALERANCPCRVTVVLNDTVAVLAGARYLDPATSIGLILGTGTNAAIEVPVRDIPKWKPQGISPDQDTAINTEWGCYCSPLLPRVQEDKDLDEASVQKGAMWAEKLMSGMYIGEAARRILLTFAQKAQLFGLQVPAKLQQEGSFPTALLSEVESDTTPLRWRVYRVLHRELGVPTSALRFETLLMVQSICRLVVRRSARVMAQLLAAVLRLQHWDKSPHKTVVAVDGGVILKYANWRRYNRQYLAEALGPQGSKLAKLIVFKPATDASSFGGAVLAIAAAEEEDEHAAQRSPRRQASKSPSRKAAPEPATPPASGQGADPAPTA